MKLMELLKSEFGNFGKYEKIFFPIVIAVICLISFLTKDNKIALISAVCGISYTILAGKGRISCYFIGITGTLCYSYLSYINGFYANLALNLMYYLPMEIIGIFMWRKHLKIRTGEIEKTKLTPKERILYAVLTVILSGISALILHHSGGKTPLFDAFTCVFSVLGQFLTVKRCIEQWYIWFFVNFLSLIMWIIAFINGSNCLATILMWAVYLVLSVYFLILWKKEINN